MGKKINNKKLLAVMLIVAIYLLTKFLMKNYFIEIYLFEWLSHNSIYDLTFVLSLILLILDKKQYSVAILGGNFIGICTGIFIGKIIYINNTKKITSYMDAELVYKLSSRYDVFIWLFTIVFLFITVIILSKRKKY